MELSVTKHFTFDAAHRLSNYHGKCYQLHGHTYKLELSFSGNVREDGMVIDFQEIKEIYKSAIEFKFDHRTILFDQDQTNHKFGSTMPEAWISWVSYNPTVENMAIDIIKLLNQEITKKKLTIKLKQIILWETPSSFATIKLD